MSRGTLRYWLDVLMGLMALVLAISSALLWVVFPRGYFAARAAWVAIHKWVGLALGIAVLVHLALHWRWLIHMTQRHLGRSGNQAKPAKPVGKGS